ARPVDDRGDAPPAPAAAGRARRRGPRPGRGGGARARVTPARSGGEQVRLFVAVDLPDDVREALAGWAADRGRDLQALRILPARSLHLTLCFLGWRPGADAGHVGRIALPDPPAARFSPPALTLYRSRLSRAGAEYEALARAEL